MGVSTGGASEQGQPATAGIRAWAFGADRARRWALHPSPAVGADLVVLRPVSPAPSAIRVDRPVVHQHAGARVTLNRSSSLTVSLRQSMTEETATRRSHNASIDPPGLGTPMVPATPVVVGAPRAGAAAARYAERIIARTVRRAPGETASIPSAPSPATRAPATPVRASVLDNLPLVTLTRPAPTKPTPPSTSLVEDSPPWTQPGRAWAVGNAVPTGPDVGRIADEVLKVIDHRITAHRERMERA